MENEAVLLVAKVVIGLSFALSSTSKFRNLASFQRTISNFHIVPNRLIKTLSVFIMFVEFIIVLLLIINDWTSRVSFLIALGLLFVFTLGIVRVLSLHIYTSCSCFGTNQENLSYTDVVRNLLLGTCALGGFVATLHLPFEGSSLPIYSSLLLIFVGCLLTIVAVNMHQLLSLVTFKA